MTKELQNLQEVFEKMTRDRAEREARERERRARQTPEQRRAEEEQARRAQEHRRQQEAAATAAKVRRAVEKAAMPYCQHESFTLLDFACLLHGYRPPGAVDRWAGMGPHEDDAAVVNTRRVLGSAVRHTADPIPGMPLYPVNPGTPEKEHRFPRAVLLEFAREKGLGHAAILSELLLGARVRTAAAPAARVSPPAPAVTPAAGPAIVRTEAAAAAMLWHRDVREFMGKVERGLKRYGAEGGQSIDSARAELLRRSTMKDLHAGFDDWLRVRSADAQHVQVQTFRLFVHGEYPSYKFARGPRPGTSGRDFMRSILAAAEKLEYC